MYLPCALGLARNARAFESGTRDWRAPVVRPLDFKIVYDRHLVLREGSALRRALRVTRKGTMCEVSKTVYFTRLGTHAAFQYSTNPSLSISKSSKKQ